jgi:hypothetical protein
LYSQMEWYGGDEISIWFHESWTVWVVSVLEVEFWSGLKLWFDGCVGETQIWFGSFKLSVDVGLWLFVRILAEFRGGWIDWLLWVSWFAFVVFLKEVSCLLRLIC